MQVHKIYFFGLFGLVVASMLAGCNAINPQPTATPEPEQVEMFNPVVNATGVVVPLQWSRLSLPAAGLIEELPVHVDDNAEAGQVLIRLQGSENLSAAIAAARLQVAQAQYNLDQLYKNPELRAAQAGKDVAEAKIAIRDAERTLRNLSSLAKQVDIEQARANVALAKDRMEDAREDYEPYANKPEDNPVRAAFLSKKAQAEKDYENAVRLLNNLTGQANALDMAEAQADHEIAQARLAVAERDWEIYQAGPDPEQVRLAEQTLVNAQSQLAAAEAALKDLELTAPFSGTISELYVRQNEWASPGQPVLLLADLSRLRVETTDLNEIDVARVKVGSKAMITFDALPELQVTGRVFRIATKASEGSSVNYTVVIELDELPEALRWGMTAFVDIETE